MLLFGASLAVLSGYVIDTANPFIVNLTHNRIDRVESLREPFRTITGVRLGEKALLRPTLTQGQLRLP